MSDASLGLEIRRLLAAVQYFTRLPVPAWVGHSQSLLDDAARYFPAVGLLVGALAAAVLVAANLLWAWPIAVVLSMITSVMVTGAFHEDGLADAADGLGGSFGRARALEIMKDSRIGVFGAAALVFALLLKFATLSTLPAATAALALIAGHAASRLGGVLIMATLPYVRDEDTSRSKPLVQQISATSIVVASVTVLLALLPLGWKALAGALGTAVATILWRRYLTRRLGGYTGDCLGAVQQLGECAFYLGCAATW